MSDKPTEESAQRLADMIKAYWAERGWDVTTRLEYIPGKQHRDGGHWRIHSDMLDGLPMKRITKVAA